MTSLPGAPCIKCIGSYGTGGGHTFVPPLLTRGMEGLSIVVVTEY